MRQARPTPSDVSNGPVPTWLAFTPRAWLTVMIAENALLSEGRGLGTVANVKLGVQAA